MTALATPVREKGYPFINVCDMLLTMTICELLGKDVFPGQVKDAFKHAQEKLKTFQESTRSASESLLPPHR